MDAPRRVFLVEDSPLIRKRVIEALGRLGGFDVLGFAEAEDEAIEAIARARPDIVVTDIRLHAGSGIEVLRHVRASVRDPAPKIYVLTNYAYPEYKRRCSGLGADGFFDKSSEFDRFLDALHAFGQPTTD